MNPNTETILIFFVGLTGFAVLLQAFVLLAIYISLRKTAQAAMEVTQDVKATVVPMVHSTRELVERITPQVMAISAGLAELTELVRKETRGVSVSASEIMQRVNDQTKRLDAMLTNGLDVVDHAGRVVEAAVAAPVRQVNGIMAAIRAIIETYRSETPRRKSSYSGTGPEADNGSGI